MEASSVQFSCSVVSDSLQRYGLQHARLSMDRGAWWATAHGVAKVRHNLATKPPPQQKSSQQQSSSLVFESHRVCEMPGERDVMDGCFRK